MTTLTQPAWYGCPDDPDLCEDPECPNLAHLPEPDDDWDDASWVELDHRAKRREDQ